LVDLTLDIQVFMSGAGTGDPAHSEESRRLMHLMQATPSAYLVLDDEGHMVREYTERCKQGFGKQWMIQMLTKSKAVRLTRVTLDKPTRTELDAQRFRGEDREWIARTAAASESGLLVAHEPHFHTTKTRKILKKRLGVKVITATAACEQLKKVGT
jgi:hypothetical protein